MALAQNVPEQFVISGKAAEKIQDFGAGGGDENYALEGLKATFAEQVTLPVYPAAGG